MKKLATSLYASAILLLSSTAMAGTSDLPTVQVDEPHMLPLLLFGILTLWVAAKAKGKK